MTLKNFRAGLEILAGYFGDADGYHIGAEHDAFYVYETDRPVSPEDVQRLVDLGWFQEDVEYADEGGDFAATDYDPEEGWCAYV